LYFLFKSDLVSWHNQTLIAKPQEDALDYQEQITSSQYHWWFDGPTPVRPSTLTFDVNTEAPLLDNYFTGTILDLYSSKLTELLAEAGVRFETFPAVVVDGRNGRVLDVEYQVFHLLEWYPAVSNKENKVPLMFRVRGLENRVVMHEQIQTTLDQAGITGCYYLHLGDLGMVDA
jgi:hypothetical protein